MKAFDIICRTVSLATAVVLPSTATADQPRLQIKHHDGAILIEWSANPAFQLEESTTFTYPMVWRPVVRPLATGEGKNVLTENLGDFPARLYRLASRHPLADEPDPLFQDTNFDGIDGDRTLAVFVAEPPFGSDLNAGTLQEPLASLPQAIQIARRSNPRKSVYVAKGTYRVNSPLQLFSGVSLYGQFDGTTNWFRGTSNETIIEGGTTAIVALDLQTKTHLEGFKIKAADATLPGESSYGLRAVGGSGLLVIRSTIITAGNGADGSRGLDGINGLPGGDGLKGMDGDDHGYGGPGGTSPCGRHGGSGSRGGANGKRGPDGEPGVGWNGDYSGPGRPGSGRGSNEQSYKDGLGGADGLHGTNALASAPMGGLIGGLYSPAAEHRGSPGTDGNGGGGGGGAVPDTGRGNGGSGGGGGGCAGAPGGGGRGGGGSFAALVVDARVQFVASTLISGNGGKGGPGGNGGLGGNGGAPGKRRDGAGKGGKGGNGGASGSGSGGAGGPSICLLQTARSSVVTDGNLFIVGNGGLGGKGGSNIALGAASDGALGESEATLSQ